MWFSPSGMKSLQLSAYLQPGPALIFFTPKNPLWDQADFYSMVGVLLLYVKSYL